jgi:thiol-disulfide isomerase/thioredoxin
MNFRYVVFFISLLLMQSIASLSSGQSIVDNELNVHESLRDLDSCLQAQGEIQIEGQKAALGPDGEQTALWWQEGNRLSPLRLYGKPILEYATAHSGSREALACLSYILEYGEGEPSELHRSACNELIEHYRDDPELSAICSYCTNAIWYRENERFLTILRQRSTSPLVQAASTFYLSKLLDNCIELQRNLVRLRDNFKDCGYFTAMPEMIAVFNNVEAMPTSDLKRRRNELLDAVVEMGGDLRPWAVKGELGRLNYEFSPAPTVQTFRDMANDLKYEISDLRVDAGDAFNNALAEAKRQDKNVILVFAGPSCPPCKVLKTFLALQAEFFGKDYIVLHIDLARMENGHLIKEKFTSDPSVPWTVIVNPASEVLCTSVGAKGNIGFPIGIEECKHFISMVEKSTIRSKGSDIEGLARELNDFVEPMRQTAK